VSQMKNFLGILVLGLLWCNAAFSKNINEAVWSDDSGTAFNKCWPILDIVCTMSQDVKTDVNSGSINSYLTVFDKNNKELIRFKIKKIEYKNGTCWLTPQPIRRYTTYFVATNCIPIR